MTADIKLLPLYAELQGHPKIEIIKHYARANVAHATAAKDAEIERLRAEREVIGAEATKYAGKSGRLEAKVERLAEALRELLIDMKQAQSNMKAATQRDPRWEGCAEAIQPRVAAAEAALRDQDQEVGK